MGRPSKVKKEDPPPLIREEMDQDGRRVLVNPSPLRGIKRPQRIRLMVGVLEHLAANGSGDSAKAVLAHERWAEEMKAGRPPLRGKVDIDHSVTLIDDIGRTHAPRQRLPAGEAKALPPGPTDPIKPAVPPTSDNNEICKPEESPE